MERGLHVARIPSTRAHTGRRRTFTLHTAAITATEASTCGGFHRISDRQRSRIHDDITTSSILAPPVTASGFREYYSLRQSAFGKTLNNNDTARNVATYAACVREEGDCE
jgi:hypothetical protein